MIISAYLVLVCNLSEKLNIFDISSADIYVKKGKIAIFFLPFNKIPELWFYIKQRLGQAFTGGYTARFIAATPALPTSSINALSIR